MSQASRRAYLEEAIFQDPMAHSCRTAGSRYNAPNDTKGTGNTFPCVEEAWIEGRSKVVLGALALMRYGIYLSDQANGTFLAQHVLDRIILLSVSLLEPEAPHFAEI